MAADYRVAGILLGSLLASVLARSGPGAEPVALENEYLRIEVDPGNGAIGRISDKPGRIQLAPAGGLADNFRLVLRPADKKNKLILGRSQKLSRVSKVHGGLDLAWDAPLTDTEGGRHDLRVRMGLRLAGQALEFRLWLANNTAHMVAEACYPVVGGLAGFGVPGGGETSIMLPTSSPTIKKVAIPFGETVLAYPGQMNMSFSSVYNPQARRAMYFAAHDTVARLKYYRYFEQSSPAGKDVFACIAHTPFTPAGKTFEGSPVVLRFHAGTWEAACPIYREWFTKTFGLMDPSRSWPRRHSFFQDAMFILPEGTLNFTFRGIPRWARAARDCGITSVLISGWHRGGHDNGYPHYEPDPRAGTYDDLRRGLEACHRMGVRVYFFVNYQPAMIESEWFKRELCRYVEMREDGGYGTCGWGMGTLWARMGHPKPMAWVDPSFPAYREALLRQFMKLVEVGADGVHVDKMFPSPMNFNPRCQLGPDTSTWEGALGLTRDLLERARKINPQFAMSFECNWDRMLTYANAVWWVGNMSLARRVFPEMVETRAILSPYDYLGVNDAVRLSQVGLVAPLNCSRSVAWEPWKGLAAYIREVKRIQDRLGEAVFFGEVLGTAQVELGHEPRRGVEYNVFRSLKTGKRVCILTNRGMEEQGQVIRAFAGNAGGRVRIHAPAAPEREAALPLVVAVPAERIVFVEELSAAGAVPPNSPAARAEPERNAGRETRSIDDVRTVSLPPSRARPLSPLPEGDDRRRIRLENECYRIEIDRANGAIVRVRDKAGKLDLVREPRLAGNFKFTLPLPGKEPWETIEANYITGSDQALSSFDSRGRSLTLRWGSPLKNRGGRTYDVAAAMGIALAGQAIRFTLRIENRTPCSLGEVFFPVLGGVTGLGNTYRDLKATHLLRPAAHAVAASNIFFLFPNFSELGDQGAEQFFLYPGDWVEPWIDLHSPRTGRSLYLGAHDKADRSKVLHLELLPGHAQTSRWDGNWPRPEELGGLAAGVVVSFVHFANHPPGKAYEASPVVLQAHDGDWHAGQSIYRKSR
jgi:hypothetical protein